MMVLNQSGRETWKGFGSPGAGALPAAAMAAFLFRSPDSAVRRLHRQVLLFAAVIDQRMWTLAVVAGLNSVVALYYYARIVRTMYLDLPIEGDPVVVIDGHSSFLVGVLMLATLVFGVYWAPVIDFAERSLLFVGR
jgi:NADH-quinone oxidoreductase subunit N